MPWQKIMRNSFENPSHDFFGGYDSSVKQMDLLCLSMFYCLENHPKPILEVPCRRQCRWCQLGKHHLHHTEPFTPNHPQMTCDWPRKDHSIVGTLNPPSFPKSLWQNAFDSVTSQSQHTAPSFTERLFVDLRCRRRRWYFSLSRKKKRWADGLEVVRCGF